MSATIRISPDCPHLGQGDILIEGRGFDKAQTLDLEITVNKEVYRETITTDGEGNLTHTHTPTALGILCVVAMNGDDILAGDFVKCSI